MFGPSHNLRCTIRLMPMLRPPSKPSNSSIAKMAPRREVLFTSRSRPSSLQAVLATPLNSIYRRVSTPNRRARTSFRSRSSNATPTQLSESARCQRRRCSLTRARPCTRLSVWQATRTSDRTTRSISIRLS